MESISKSLRKLSLNNKEDLHDLIIKKNTEFLENIHSKQVTERYHFDLPDFSKLEVDVKPDIIEDQTSLAFNKILFNKEYKNKNIQAINEEDATEFLEYEENRIFVEYNENLFNFTNFEEDEKFYQIDLLGGEQKSITEDKQIDNSVSNDNNSSLVGSNDIIAVNHFPISLAHAILALHNDKNFCQVLSNELISQALEIFNLTSKNNLKVGYNSLAAGCIINQLHFELFWNDGKDLSGRDDGLLAIERVNGDLLFSTNLIYLNEEESSINVFNPDVNIKVYEINNYSVKAWKIQVTIQEGANTDNLLRESHTASMAFVSGIIFSSLNSKEIPHNLVFTDNGMSCYIIPRKLNDKDLGMNCAWLDICGIPTIYSEELLKDIKDKGLKVISELLSNEISLEKEDFKIISIELLEKFKEKFVLK